MIKVKVVSIGEKTKNNNYIHKVVSETKATVLGIEKISKLTYYVALPAKAKVGSEHDLNLDMFRVVERGFEHPQTGDTIMLKWLHLK